MLSKIGPFLEKNALTIILAIVPPIIIWYGFQRESSNLSVKVISESSVISLNAAFSDGIEILYNKEPIEALFVTDIRITNEGTRPIEKSDFDSPIRFRFNGNVINPVKTVSTTPQNLVISPIVANNEVTISPLLLNPDDSFIIQVKIADPKDGDLTIDPHARIKGVKELSFVPYSDTEDPWKAYLFGVISSVLAAVSLTSLRRLFKNIKISSISLSGLTIELTKELESDESIVKRVESLAEHLDVARHDFKSNLLLLRLKIESQLRELVRINDVPIRGNIGSISMLSDALFRAGIIGENVVAIIRDISPAMNRELHEASSYLTDEEYQMLQQAALFVIATLVQILDETNNENT